MNPAQSPKRRVLVVDHSAFARSVLAAMIRSRPDFEVVASAVDGEEAIRLALRHRPDLVVMDIELPRVGGLGFLRWLMKYQPVPVLVVTGAGGGREMLRALELGAVDFVLKPTAHASEQLFKIRDELLRKLEALAAEAVGGEAAIRPAARPAPAPAAKASRLLPARATQGPAPLVVVGASTGGPPALQHLLSKLPAEFPAAVVIAQHMPAQFTAIFAERLDRVVGLEVAEARDGEEALPGRCLILPGGKQGVLRKLGERIVVRLRDRHGTERYCPSVDLLLESAAEVGGGRVTAVVLTGMGDDGAKGIVKVREAGGRTIAEASETSVVFGMPQAAIQTGTVEQVLPLHEIAARLRLLTQQLEETLV